VEGLAVKAVRTGIALALGLAIASCAKIEWDSFRAPKFTEYLRLPSMGAAVPVETRGPVRAEDLVDGEGRCAELPMASAAPAAEGADPVTISPTASLAASGIALAMTECDVVKRAGPPEKVELGSNERAERAVTLSYSKGLRPGIYKFAAGRLVSIERAPEPPTAPKPERPAKPAKPKPKPAAT
jgi:hypothetical protein